MHSLFSLVLLFSLVVFAHGEDISTWKDDPPFLRGYKWRRDNQQLIVDALKTSDGSDQWKKVEESFRDNDELSNAVLIIGDRKSGQLLKVENGKRKDDELFVIASASKWVSSTTIMKLVDQNKLSLSDNPQKYIPWWTKDFNDDRANITLSQLLSFISGCGEVECAKGLGKDDISLENCVKEVYNTPLQYKPGSTFNYASCHLQIAAVMALYATGITDWNELFAVTLRDPLGLSDDTIYTPESNPMLAAGLKTSASDYHKFLSALYKGDILSNTSFALMLQDHTFNTSFATNPAASQDLGWHYGYGHWLECNEEEWSSACFQGIHSSPGYFGFYPWIDIKNDYYGLVATSSLLDAITTIIIVVCAVGGFLLLLAVGIIIFCVYRRKKRKGLLNQ